MAEIKARLQETSQACLDAYEAWASKKKDAKAQETLHDTIHELRKVSSRLEIELAVSERDQLASKPLPIPSHKSNQKETTVSILDQGEDNGNNEGKSQKSSPRRKRPQPRKQG